MFSISKRKHTFSLNLFATKATIGDLKILQLRSLKITLSFSHLVANMNNADNLKVRLKAMENSPALMTIRPLTRLGLSNCKSHALINCCISYIHQTTWYGSQNLCNAGRGGNFSAFYHCTYVKGLLNIWAWCTAGGMEIGNLPWKLHLELLIRLAGHLEGISANRKKTSSDFWSIPPDPG